MRSAASGESYAIPRRSATSVKPITPSPTARLSALARSDSGTDDTVMSMRLSSWRTARRTARAIRSQSRSPAASPRRKTGRLIEARLQTEIVSRSCGRQISVQRFDRWMVPVLVFSARVLMVSFQVSHGWEVVCRVSRICLYCSRARTRENVRSRPASASATYCAYRAENAAPVSSTRSGVSAGSNRYQSSSAATRFMNSSLIQTAVFAVRVRRYGSPEFCLRSRNCPKSRCQFSM